MNPTWGTGGETDWKKAAEDAGNDLLKINPNLLIIIEGLNYALDLTPIKKYPIHLNVPNKLVYSSHAYSWELSSYSSYDQTKKDLDAAFGFITEPYQPWTAPLWLGEFGANSNDNYWKFIN